jgi:hypothetical protein
MPSKSARSEQSSNQIEERKLWIILAILWWLTATALPCASVGAAEPNQRLFMNATINGKPAKLAFDTGSGEFFLFRDGAARLGLAYAQAPVAPPFSGRVAAGETVECDLVVEDNSVRTTFRVIDDHPQAPPRLDWSVDGMLGWYPLRSNVFEINASVGTVVWMTHPPIAVSSWTKLNLSTNSDVLELELPYAGGKISILAVDTGADVGVTLPTAEWASWKRANPSQPTTLSSRYGLDIGVAVTEEAWARQLSLGRLTLTEVPVTQAAKGEGPGDTERWVGTLGLAALRRLDCIIDGYHGVAYLRPRKSPPVPYYHNRLGAVFAPVDNTSDQLTAHVAQQSPAFEAGVRDGDILLRVDEIDATKWRANPSGSVTERFWTSPPGTKVELGLRRGNKTFTVRAVLRNIIPPDDTQPSKPAAD